MTSEAAAEAARALRLAFTRDLHFDGLTSPIADEHDAFTRPFKASTTMSALRAPRGRGGSDKELSGGSRRGTRVLVATWKNANFVGEIADFLTGHPGAKFQQVDLQKLPGLVPYARNTAAFVEEVLGGKRELVDRLERHLRGHLDWADVVFVDWCTAGAAMLTMVDPGDTRVIVRLHSFEAFTKWPHLVDFSRVDDLVFVSEHIRDLTVAAVPALSGTHAPRTHVLPLAWRLQRYRLSKVTGATASDPELPARFTLGLIGWSAVAKDPKWALDVIRALHERDKRYRLLLIGHEFNDEASAAAEEYGKELWPLLEELEGVGAVERRPQTDDVPSALREVGVILSSSVREGCHTALMEGAASGAVPVVRDWPFFAGRPNGARTLVPEEWVVGSPEEAVDRILATTGTDEIWRDHGEAAAAEALRRWDWGNVRPAYERLLLGSPHCTM